MQNRVFFPQEALDAWLVNGKVDLAGAQLTILAEGRRYHLAEGVHVLNEVTGAGDPNEIVGRVKSKVFFEELGAELLETSMILGDNAYDVVPGWLGVPMGTFDEHRISQERAHARASRPESEFSGEEPHTDEDLLAHYLLSNLK